MNWIEWLLLASWHFVKCKKSFMWNVNSEKETSSSYWKFEVWDTVPYCAITLLQIRIARLTRLMNKATCWAMEMWTFCHCGYQLVEALFTSQGYHLGECPCVALGWVPLMKIRNLVYIAVFDQVVSWWGHLTRCPSVTCSGACIHLAKCTNCLLIQVISQTVHSLYGHKEWWSVYSGFVLDEKNTIFIITV